MTRPDQSNNKLSSELPCAGEQSRDEVEAFIQSVGRRVQGLRKEKKMSRRVLSELSGVSQRTLVLLETGVGNISLALLFRVSTALGQSVPNLVARHNTDVDANRLAEQFVNVSPIQQQKIIELLKADSYNDTKQKRICLIGLRGAGKSTLGKRLSNKIGSPFVELNEEIELLGGMSIQELMDLYGQEGYRNLEQQALKNVTNNNTEVIVAAAGGVVNDKETYNYLLQHFHTIWLKATPEEHIERVIKQGDERPMAGNPEAMSVLRTILINREEYYQKADSSVDTSRKSIQHSTDELATQAQKLLAQSIAGL